MDMQIRVLRQGPSHLSVEDLFAVGIVPSSPLSLLFSASGTLPVATSSITTTSRDRSARPAPDLVERDFTATAPKQLWVADITYVPTASGFLYLSVVSDAFGCCVVGWSMAGHLRTELVVDAPEMAVKQRRPQAGRSSRPVTFWESARPLRDNTEALLKGPLLHAIGT